MTSTQRAFFDADDDDLTIPAVRDMTIGPVSTSDVQEFGRRYHYSHNGNNAAWRWGLWHGPVLFGVVSYNLPTKHVCGCLFGPEHHEHVWNMGRLILADSAPHNSESRLIGLSLRRIVAEFPQVWGVVTYASTLEGHIGYVYQATNAVYTGLSSGERVYVDSGGAKRGTYYIGQGVTQSRAADLGWTAIPGGAVSKHRYVYILGNKTERRARLALLKLPTLPYPKQGATP